MVWKLLLKNCVEELRRRVTAVEDYFAGVRVKEGEVLDGINLRKAYLRGAYLCYVSLVNANLNNARLRGASLDGAILIISIFLAQFLYYGGVSRYFRDCNLNIQHLCTVAASDKMFNL